MTQQCERILFFGFHFFLLGGKFVVGDSRALVTELWARRLCRIVCQLISTFSNALYEDLPFVCFGGHLCHPQVGVICKITMKESHGMAGGIMATKNN